MLRIQTIAALALCSAAALNAQAGDALLVVAHGTSRGTWNERVTALVDKVQWDGPKGVAFLTPATPDQALEKVAAKLDESGVKRIVLVPLLISSYSDHYEEIRYYARDRQEVPDHAHGTPLKTRAEIVMGRAMDAHPLVSRILADEVRSVSVDPKRETVILVAHGPNDDADNVQWLERLETHAAYLRETGGFARVRVATMRDDAADAVKAAAVAKLKEFVSSDAADSTVLVQPVLISVGHVQAEIAKLLEGLPFKMSDSGVSTHPLAVEWIRQTSLRSQP